MSKELKDVERVFGFLDGMILQSHPFYFRFVIGALPSKRIMTDMGRAVRTRLASVAGSGWSILESVFWKCSTTLPT